MTIESQITDKKKMDDDITTLTAKNKFINSGAACVILSKFGGDVEKALVYSKTLKNQLFDPHDLYRAYPEALHSMNAAVTQYPFLLHRWHGTLYQIAILFQDTKGVLEYIKQSKHINLENVPASIDKGKVAELQETLPNKVNDVARICAALQRPYPNCQAATLLLLDEANLLYKTE